LISKAMRLHAGGLDHEIRADHRIHHGRIDEFDTRLDEWMATSDGHRIPHRAVLRGDGDAKDRHLLTVEFNSYELGMENSGRLETGEFAAFLAEISDSALTFRNLDVLREEDL